MLDIVIQYLARQPAVSDRDGSVYDGMQKDRVTMAHGVLCDAVMTYVVWCNACNAGLC